MVQPRIDQLAFLAEGKVPYRKKDGGENGTRLDNNQNHREPYRVTMVGDSTMMQQFGVICAFLAERAGRRFDPAVSRWASISQACCFVCYCMRKTTRTRAGQWNGHREVNL